MTQLAWVRIALALGAMALFGIGIRTGDDRLRWIAIGLLGGALALRFAKPRK